MRISTGATLLFVLVGCLVLDQHICSGAKILVLSFISSKSHKLTYMPLVEELGKRGHQITVLTPVKAFKEAVNVKEIMTIDGEAAFDKMQKDSGIDAFKAKESNQALNPFSLFHLFADMCKESYDLPQVRKIMEESFDLVILQPMFNDCALGLIYRLKAPFILFSPVSVASFLVDKVGLYFPSFVPNVLLDLPLELNFYQRFVNFGFDMLLSATIRFVYQPSIHEIFREKLGDDIPSINEILANTSLILSNGHFSLQGHKPLTPDIVEVSGIHSRPAKPVPKDLEDFIKKGKDGFILFSMGSIIKADTMPEEKRLMFLNVFSKLKQQVLWKWESETMPGLPPNVKLSKWLPQQDILGHKDIKLFITHCGGGSTEEAIYHSVPLVGLPMVGDQPGNAKFAKRHGFIVDLDWNTVTEDQLLNAINEVLTNPVYKENVEKLSRTFKDRPIDPMEHAIYSVEYVLRHKGAPHLRSAGRKLNYFQYHSYDVIFVYALLISIVLYLVLKVLKYVTNFVGSKIYDLIVTNSLVLKIYHAIAGGE